MIRLANAMSNSHGNYNVEFPPVAWWVETETKTEVEATCLVTVFYRTSTNLRPVRLLAYRFKRSETLSILPPEAREGSFALAATLGEVARLRDERRRTVDDSLRKLGSRREENITKCLSSKETRSILREVARLQCLIDIFKEAKSWYGAHQLLEEASSKTQSLNSG